MMLGNFRIDEEMLVGHDNFTIKIFLRFLPALSFFSGHTVARLKDSLEVALVRKCQSIVLDLVMEVRLALVLWPILFPLQHGLGIALLFGMGRLKNFYSCLIGLLGVLVPVLALIEIVKAVLGNPARLAFKLRFHLDLVLVDDREGPGQTLLTVGVEVVLVLRDHLSHLLFLNLPNVVFLVSIRVHLEALRHLDSSLGQAALAHCLELLLVNLLEVRHGGSSRSLPQAGNECTILVVSVRFELLGYHDLFLVRGLLFLSELLLPGRSQH